MEKKYLKKITSALSAVVFLSTIVLPGNLFAQTKETQYFPIPSSRVGPYSAMYRILRCTNRLHELC